MNSSQKWLDDVFFLRHLPGEKPPWSWGWDIWSGWITRSSFLVYFGLFFLFALFLRLGLMTKFARSNIKLIILGRGRYLMPVFGYVMTT